MIHKNLTYLVLPYKSGYRSCMVVVSSCCEIFD